jgi:hypothetical protein
MRTTLTDLFKNDPALLEQVQTWLAAQKTPSGAPLHPELGHGVVDGHTLTKAFQQQLNVGKKRRYRVEVDGFAGDDTRAAVGEWLRTNGATPEAAMMRRIMETKKPVPPTAQPTYDTPASPGQAHNHDFGNLPGKAPKLAASHANTRFEPSPQAAPPPESPPSPTWDFSPKPFIASQRPLWEKGENYWGHGRSQYKKMDSDKVCRSFDPEACERYLVKHAFACSNEDCAIHVRLGLSAGGLKEFDTDHPYYAKSYVHYLPKYGFVEGNWQKEGFKIGDVCVLGPPKGRKEGHICVLTSKGWVSDFVQKGFNPYKTPVSGVHFYRHISQIAKDQRALRSEGQALTGQTPSPPSRHAPGP